MDSLAQELSKARLSATALAESLSDIVAGDVPMLLVLLLLIALLGRAAVLAMTLLWRRPLRPDEQLELLLGGTCGAAILAPLALGEYTELAHWRYFMVLPVIALVWVVHLCLRAGRYGAARRSGYLPAGFVLVSCACMASQAVENARSLSSPGPMQVCIEAENRTAGISEYWTAKLLMLMSERRIHVVQIYPDGEPDRRNYNQRWFTERADDGTALRPDFIIPTRLDPGMLRRRFGAPSRVRDCGREELWLYDRPLQLPGS